MENKKENCMAYFSVKQIHPKQTDKMVQDARKALYHVFKKYK